MLGAITGDIVGSIYEFSFDCNRIKTTDFPLFQESCEFTDDTVLTCAVADAILTGASYREKLQEYYHYYPHASYGGNFSHWARFNRKEPYNSFGNGSAMRVSPVGYAFNDLETVLSEAKRSAEVSHNHPEGIKGAQATAAAIYLARTGKTKDEIKDYIESNFKYDLSFTLDEIRPDYSFSEICQTTVPQSIVAFLESNDFEHAIRLAISLGGDADTLACITGGIAEAFYGVPNNIKNIVYQFLDKRLERIVNKFYQEFIKLSFM